MPTKARKSKTKGAEPRLETTLWAAADKLRGHMDAAEYKHVVLGLIFLKCITDAFEEHQNKRRALEIRGSAGRQPLWTGSWS